MTNTCDPCGGDREMSFADLAATDASREFTELLAKIEGFNRAQRAEKDDEICDAAAQLSALADEWAQNDAKAVRAAHERTDVRRELRRRQSYSTLGSDEELARAIAEQKRWDQEDAAERARVVKLRNESRAAEKLLAEGRDAVARRERGEVWFPLEGWRKPPEWDPMGLAPFAWDLPEPGSTSVPEVRTPAVWLGGAVRDSVTRASTWTFEKPARYATVFTGFTAGASTVHAALSPTLPLWDPARVLIFAVLWVVVLAGSTVGMKLSARSDAKALKRSKRKALNARMATKDRCRACYNELFSQASKKAGACSACRSLVAPAENVRCTGCHMILDSPRSKALKSCATCRRAWSKR